MSLKVFGQYTSPAVIYQPDVEAELNMRQYYPATVTVTPTPTVSPPITFPEVIEFPELISPPESPSEFPFVTAPSEKAIFSHPLFWVLAIGVLLAFYPETAEETP